MDYNLQIVWILTVGFGLASLFGYLTQRLKLPSILGYLLAGYLIGPFSPGFVADSAVAEQLAEIGVILMLFGVGLHFKLEDLFNVRNVAIPGAVGQTIASAFVAATFIYYLGWPLEAGMILGLAISVASTVVLVRVLSDFHLLDTPQGHIAMGWLIVEDILTVIVLLLLPMLATFFIGNEAASPLAVIGSIFWAFAKFAILAFILFRWGHQIVDTILTSVARLRSHELFTLTILALTFIIAVGSTFLFGTSIALGAFLAGMMIGKSEVRHQAAANSLPLKDAFAVIFFLSVGMLFNPIAISTNLTLFIGILAIILFIKPFVALMIVLGLGYSLKIALTVGFALAQIGEFSFILAESAMNLKLLPDEGYDILVACAFISISLNPLLFRCLDSIKAMTDENSYLGNKQAKHLKTPGKKFTHLFDFQKRQLPRAIVVGFGPIGQASSKTLLKCGFQPIIIEQNIDTVTNRDETYHMVFGDACQPSILETAQIHQANLLVITVPNVHTAHSIIQFAIQLNPRIRILARTHYVHEETIKEGPGLFIICSEKELSKAFTERLYQLAKHL